MTNLKTLLTNLCCFLILSNAFAQCDASFSISDSNPCGEESIVLSANTIDTTNYYLWTFSCDPCPDATGPSIIYSFPDDLNGYDVDVTLTVSDSLGCVQSVTQDLSVQPTSSISIDGTIGECVPSNNQQYEFDATFYISNSNGDPYFIEFGDGADMFTSETTITHTFVGYDTYTVIVSQENPLSSCIGTDTLFVNFFQRPTVAGNLCEGFTDVCEGVEFCFELLTESNFTYHVLDMGDGEGAVTLSIGDTLFYYSYEFEDDDACEILTSLEGFASFQISQTAVAGPGCEHTQTVDIYVYPKPRPDFTIPGCPCAGSEITLLNTSCAVYGNTYLWMIYSPNGQLYATSTELEPSIYFSEPGTYEVVLTATSINGCGQNVKVKNIEIVENPYAGFEIENYPIDGIYCNEATISLIDNSIGYCLGYSYSIFPDSGWIEICDNEDIDCLSTAEPVIYFFESDTFEIIQTVTNSCSTATYQQTIIIANDPMLEIAPIEDACGTLNLLPDYTLDIGTCNLSACEWYLNDILIPVNFCSGETLVLEPGEYCLYGAASNCCGAATSLPQCFTVHEVDSLSPIADTVLCVNDSCLDLPDNQGQVWTFLGSNIAIAEFCPDIGAGTYFLVQSATLGFCESTDTLEIEVLSLPEIELGMDSLVVVCIEDGPLVLQAFPEGGVWKKNGIPVDSNIVYPSDIGTDLHTYIYCYTDPLSGCTAMEWVHIDVRIAADVSIPDGSVVCNESEYINLEEELEIVETDFSIYWYGPAIQDSTIGLFDFSLAGLAVGDSSIVYYTTISEYGCQYSDSIKITVAAYEVVFAGPDTTVCLEDEFYQLVPSLTGGYWVGPGVDEFTGIVDLNLAFVPGTSFYTYQYIYAEDSSCESISEVTLEIFDVASPNPGSDVEVCETAGSYTLEPEFIPLDTEISWEGPEIDSNSGVVNIANLAAGQCYEYTMVATSNDFNYCSSSNVVQLCVIPKVVANFSIPSVLCENQPAIFTNTSINATQFIWTFPDTTYTIENPEHTFSESGEFQVTLTAISLNSITGEVLCDSSITQTVSVQALSIADFSLSTNSGCAPLTISVTDNSLPSDINITYYIGDVPIFPSGNPFEITLPSGKSDTTYYISAVASNDCSEAIMEQEVTVFPEVVSEFITNQDSYCNGADILVQIIECGDPDSFVWTVDSVFYSNEVSPLFSFSDANFETVYHMICLESINDCGSDVYCKELSIHPDSIEGIFNIPTDVYCVDEEIQFTAAPQDVSLSYSFGDQDSTTTAVPNPVFSYSEPGEYMVRLQFFGCGYFEYFDTITILPRPVPAFSVDSSICHMSAVLFNDNSMGVVDYQWSFGDGNTSGISNPVHTYAQIGSYEVKLVGTSVGSCKDSITKIVEVLPLPIPEIDMATTVCTNENFQIINTTPGFGLSYFWDFGNGDTATISSPNYMYEEPGIYLVSVEVVDLYGCSAEYSGELSVLESPTLDIDIFYDSPCVGNTITVQGSVFGADEFRWELNGTPLPNFQNQLSFDLAINEPGVSTIKLIAENDVACSFEISELIEFFPEPDIVIHSRDISCHGLNDGEIWLDSSEIFDQSYFVSLHYPNDSTELSGTQFQNLKPGNYQIDVFNINGCKTTENIILYEPAPIWVEAFLEGPDTILRGEYVQLGVNYLGADPWFNWSPADDLSCDECISPKANPLSETNYVVTLTDEFNCTATDTITIVVLPSRVIFVPNAFSPNDDLYNEVFMIRSGNPGLTNIALFEVQDRWGATVFKASDFQPNDPEFGWDGKIRGHDIQPGVFTWYAIVEFVDGVSLKLMGDVLLKK